MLGCLAGDVAGSIFEGSSHNDVSGPLFYSNSSYTDDSVMVCAVAEALVSGEDVASALRRWVISHPARGYGAWFKRWCHTPGAPSYNSYGNGGAVRVAPVALVARSEAEVRAMTVDVAGVTHSDPAAMHASEVLALAIYRLVRGATKEEIRTFAEASGMWRHETVSQLRELAEFSELATHSVPVAFVCALEASSTESAIRNAIAVGGDTDTIAAMAGAIAEPLYGIPDDLRLQVEPFITPEMLGVLAALYGKAGHPYPLPGSSPNTSPRPTRQPTLSGWRASLLRWLNWPSAREV
jgi:ADP-ribosyl-[dinitrogen reductase] hydrolase